MNILVIPDSHATPSHNNDRFDWLGQFIVDRKPDIIVNIGDGASMDSLSSYDKGKRSFEGRRYVDDIDAAIDAQDRMFKPLIEHNAFRKKHYNPKKYITIGNHENRINRATNDAAELYGLIGIEDLEYEKFGWEVVPFLEVLNIEGVNFSHYFPSGVMGRAIGGVNLGRSLITKTLSSCVQGHSHILSQATETTTDGKRVWGVSVGCYVDFYEDFSPKSAQDKYWRGLVMLNNVKDGDFDIETIRLSVIKEMYG